MTYDLWIGDRSFSSWSLRGWLMFETFGLPVQLHEAGLYAGTLAQDLAPLAPARLVPVLRTPEGVVVGDTAAMAAVLEERHPELQLWPDDPAARALARWMVAEMHSGFPALRGDCPMDLRHAWSGFAVSDALAADLARLEDLWCRARAHAGASGPWLFGAWSMADVFYLPAATRIATYGLPAGPEAQAYVAEALALPALQAWRARGLQDRYEAEPYDQDLPQRPWPGPQETAVNQS
ncbi:glutathione S-transferase [Pseudoroseicyclus aestuarii]|uniref:Glutathione S-transferase n=1 Tax=Pseudoroseicyclus aestuarii TaxID=1795041 RepID=A0A318SWL7_9RHOB|nr:glutathione S-transferase [Pseudoroseicyclus aestuarii]PYE84799.1 glutathione S-transferase [Pseudoroseicyclus aestuarii]